MTLRLVPTVADESEVAIVAAGLVHPRTVDECRRLGLTAEMIAAPRLHMIAEAQLELAAEGVLPDLAAVWGRIVAHDRADAFRAVGGRDHLVDVMGDCVTVEGLAYHVGVVADAAERRRITARLADLGRRAEAGLPLEEVRAGLRSIIDRGPAATVPTAIGITTPIVEFLGDENDADNPEPMLVAPFLPAGVVAFLAGEPKAGKTWLAISLAVHVALGRRFLDRYAVEQGPVVVLTEEDTQPQIRRRLWHLARGLEADPRSLPMRCSALAGFRLDDRPQLERLVSEAKGARLIVVDALTRVHGADENDRTAMQAVTLALSRLAAETEATVLAVHHMRKKGPNGDNERAGQRMRGTGDLHALARAILALKKRSDGLVQLEAEGNYAADIEPIALAFHMEGDPAKGEKRRAWFSYEGGAKEAGRARVEEEVFAAIHGEAKPLSKADVRKLVGGTVADVDAAIKRLAKAQRIELVEAEKVRADGKPMAFQGWRAKQ